jgi:phage terminase large subunit
MDTTPENQKIQNLVSELKPIDIRSALFKSKDFNFIVTGKDEDGKICTHLKQEEALQILTANIVEEFLYGGAAGGAKTWTGCCWLLFMCINYPGTRWFVARKELKDIIDSVYVTFKKVCDTYGFSDYKFNGQKHFIQFGNGSHINLIEVSYKPSDPMFEGVGSTEYTGGWMEEVGEIHPQAYIVLRTRIGRHLNKKYGIKKMMFMSGNPKKNWTKTQFYDKDKAGTIESHKRYLGCLVTENPFIEKDYVESLRRLASEDKASFERLFKGNWEYEDNPNALCDYEMIEAIFSNNHVPQGQTFITADIARFGSDKAVICVWRGWRLIELKTFDVSKTTDIQLLITQLRLKYHIPKNRCVGDADGVGGGVIDNTGIKAFINNATPIREQGDNQNYKNLQVQCLFHLARIINEGKIWIMCELSEKQRSDIKQELDQIHSKLNDIGKLDCKSKSDIKQDIGRSPDYRDAIFMRVFFDLKPNKRRFMGSILR